MVVRHLQDMINFDLLKEYDSILKDTLKVWQKEKTYSLNEVVQYKGNYLKCTTAGKSGTTLDFTDKDIGDTITDGTAAWEMVEPPSGGGGIAEYNTGKSYYSGDLVIKDNVLYKSNTTTSTTWVDSEWDVIGTTFNITSTYAQKIVTNVIAPYEMLLQVGDSNYCKPPIDVLKKTGGVGIDGSWSQSVHGTDYSVAYPNKTTMSVRLLTNGDYIINYPISSNS